MVYAEAQQVDMHEDGEELVGRISTWQTQLFRYAGLSRAGRPLYQRDRTARPYLKGLRSAAEVRRVLAQHRQRAKSRLAKAA